jgi:hypothetical protein
MHGSAGALLNREVGSGTARRMVAHGCTLGPFSWLEASMLGYLVCRIPTVAPGPTSGEAANLQVGLTSSFPT